MNRQKILEQLPYITIQARGSHGKTVDVLVDGDYDGEYFSTLCLRVLPAGHVQVVGYGTLERDKNGVKIPHNFGGEKKRSHKYLHELILPNRPGLWKHYIDGNKFNNRSCNLEYVTPKEMMKYRRPRSPQIRRDHCRYGHEYTEENTYIDKKGYRSCKTCRKVNYLLGKFK